MNNKKLPQNNGVRKAYLSVQETAEYTGMGVRTIRGFLNDPINPLPHYRIGTAGRIIRINRDEIDNWIRFFKVDSESIDIDDLVDAFIEIKRK